MISDLQVWIERLPLTYRVLNISSVISQTLQKHISTLFAQLAQLPQLPYPLGLTATWYKSFRERIANPYY
ncbi:hypothetical protein [Coleofasciculus sp.]|uniref:hypothetical protein n=1 Tax=Coleofasciculus sp. TaxID=3100458 RepID=UPI003A45D9CB